MTTTTPPGATTHLGGEAWAHPDAAAAGLVPVEDLHHYPGNPRTGDVDAIADSLRTNGVYRPLYVQRSTAHVLAGNHTLDAIVALGGTHAPVVWLDVDDDQARRIVLVDNRAAELGGYDETLLLEALRAAQAADELLAGTGYGPDVLAEMEAAARAAEYVPPVIAPTLADRFVIPPFTVLDARSGPWQERKRRWLALGIQSEVGRGVEVSPHPEAAESVTERVADVSEGTDLWTRAREALAAAVKAKGWRHRDLDEYLGTNGMAGHYLGRAQPEVPTPAQWARLAEVLDLPDDLHGPMTETHTRPGAITATGRGPRRTLGAVQTNLDGEDAARYGRKDTRATSRSFKGQEDLTRIKPDLAGALAGDRPAAAQKSSPYSKGNPRTDPVSAKIAATNTRTLGQGLQAHRDPTTGELVYTETTAAGVSIFDPVLTELAYRWFSPLGGHVLDPFAGGSVRGIVASALGRDYTGIELRDEQVVANRVQGEQIVPRLGRTRPRADTVQVKVSAASARQEFHGCEPDYIKDVCHGRCCRSPQSSTGTGTMITIHPSEEAAIAAQGGVVVDGLLQPREGEQVCPFQGAEDHLCGLHGTPAKPYGCIASPFTLNDNGTLIVRNRYRQLCCYKDTREDGTQLPAYVAFRASLDLIFGEDEAARVCAHLEAGGGDLVADMPARSFAMLTENDQIKHGGLGPRQAAAMPRWVTGDSREADDLLPKGETYDLVFSCPPYADLEVYSDDPADLSAMPYDDFLEAYRQIIATACARLRDDRFAVWVIGEVRDRRGEYRGLVPDTIAAFRDAGLSFYNEAILVTPVGSLPIRAGRQFSAGRKMGKTHQNVLVFCKGDPRAAADACGVVDVTMPDVDEEGADA